MNQSLSNEELELIEQRARRATPGPWFVVRLDDEWAMNLVAISTDEHLSGSFRANEVDHRAIVAATLVQGPRYVDHASNRNGYDAEFIANARSDIPRLIAEVRRLQQHVESAASISQPQDRPDHDPEP